MASDTHNSVWQKFYCHEKGTEKASDTDMRKGIENAPSLVLASDLHNISIGYYSKSKECLKAVKVLPDLLPQYTF